MKMINFMLGDLSERLNEIRKKLSTKGSHWPENWQFPRFFREVSPTATDCLDPVSLRRRRLCHYVRKPKADV